MADETWSAKASPDVKKDITELVESSGLTNKELLEAMVSNYKAELLKGSDTENSEDIQQVTYHLAKIKDAFIANIQRGTDLKERYTLSLEQESVTHKQIVDQIQKQFKLAEEERDKIIIERVESEKILIDVSQRNKELEEINTSQRITIQMQQEKLNQLETRIESTTKLEEKNKQLIQTELSQSKQIEFMQQESENHKRELQQAQSLKDAQTKESLKSVEQFKQIHQLEMGMAIIEAEKKMLESIQTIKDEYSSKIETLTNKNQELIEKNHALEMKIKLDIE